MPTILHISDLHRTPGPHLSNDELFAAIASDARRWPREGIPNPDLVVVSGDVIQGVRVGTSDPDAKIVAQYGEASDFLRRLTAEFVDSDRSRVVIVPGNHDVHWERSLSAMTLLKTCPERIDSRAFDATSNVRWDWRNQDAYEITDRDIYESRFQHFRQFRDDFYADLDPSLLSHGNSDIVFGDYPSLGLVVAGFASWHGNDCFCHVGDIDIASLATSRKLLASSNAPIAIAVWHHSVVGGPRENDYMDQCVIHKLIDFGFSVGLHGHQHYPGAAPFELWLPNRTSMGVVGAGSMAVGDHELPMGEHRQFNIVEINPTKQSITVHVRAMSSSGVFAASYRDEFGGNPHIQLSLPDSSLRYNPPSSIGILDKAMTAVTTEEYEQALQYLAQVGSSYAERRRIVEIGALDGLGRHEELIELLNPPHSAEEAIRAISLLLERDRFDEASARLEAASELIDRSHFEELSRTIATRRMMS